MAQPLFRVYIAVSVDGYIATPDGGVAWLDGFAAEDYGYDHFYADIGTVVMGRATYEQARGFGDWPYAGKRAMVLTSRPCDALPAMVETVALAGLDDVIARLRHASGGDIWIVGGGRTVDAFLERRAVDRLELYVMPVLFGAGVPLFPGPGPTGGLVRESVRAMPRGVVELIYRVEPDA